MKNKLWLPVVAGIVSTMVLPKTHTYASELPKVDIQGEFASFHDIVLGMKGSVSFNSETTTYQFSVQNKTFELNHLSGYALVDGVDEPYQLRASESDESVTNVVRVSPVLFEEELYVPIEFVERFLNLTYEDGNFKSDDEIIFEGDEEQDLITPPAEDSEEQPEDSKEESVEKPEEQPEEKPENNNSGNTNNGGNTGNNNPGNTNNSGNSGSSNSGNSNNGGNTGNNNSGNTNNGGNTSTGGSQTKPNVDPVVVKSISVDRTSITMTHGGSDKITAKVNPFNVPDTSVTYASNDTGVVTADKNGNLKAVGVGTTTITVISNYTPTVRTTVTVTVNPVAVTGISLNKGNTTLEVGGTLSVSATVSPSNATNKGVKWTSSNTSVATVDANGNVKAVAAGTAIITVTSTSNTGVKASLTVTVNAPKPPAQPTYTAASVMSTLISKHGWYSDQGVPYIGDWEGMRHTEGAVYLTNEQGYQGVDATLFIRNPNFNNAWGQAQTALSYFTDSASTLISYVQNGKWGTYQFSGRTFTLSVSPSGVGIIQIGPKY